MLKYCQLLKEPSRNLRKNMTDAEQVLWSRIRRKQLDGVQFYRQKPIGPYIVDFYSFEVALVIEVDGGQHHEPEHIARDTIRDTYLADAGLRVLRFDNLQVLKETEAAVDKIFEVIRERKSPPAPLSEGG